jgi:hypothetical protein
MSSRTILINLIILCTVCVNSFCKSNNKIEVKKSILQRLLIDESLRSVPYFNTILTLGQADNSVLVSSLVDLDNLEAIIIERLSNIEIQRQLISIGINETYSIDISSLPAGDYQIILKHYSKIGTSQFTIK